MLSTPPTKPSFVKYTGTVIRYKNMVLFHAALQDIIKDDYLWTFNNNTHEYDIMNDLILFLFNCNGLKRNVNIPLH